MTLTPRGYGQMGMGRPPKRARRSVASDSGPKNVATAAIFLFVMAFLFVAGVAGHATGHFQPVAAIIGGLVFGSLPVALFAGPDLRRNRILRGWAEADWAPSARSEWPWDADARTVGGQIVVRFALDGTVDGRRVSLVQATWIGGAFGTLVPERRGHGTFVVAHLPQRYGRTAIHRMPPFDSMPSGQGPAGQPRYGQPAYGQPAYGQPAYGQPGYRRPGYGQAGPVQFRPQRFGPPWLGPAQVGQSHLAQPQDAGPPGSRSELLGGRFWLASQPPPPPGLNRPELRQAHIDGRVPPWSTRDDEFYAYVARTGSPIAPGVALPMVRAALRVVTLLTGV